MKKDSNEKDSNEKDNNKKDSNKKVDERRPKKAMDPIPGEKDGLLGDAGSERGRAAPDWSRFGLTSNKGGEGAPQNDDHGGHFGGADNELFNEEKSQQHDAAGGFKPWWKANFLLTERVLFGTWDGVFTSCMINIFGVVIFLRTGWMVGNAGIGLSMLIILATVSVALIAVLSAIGMCERLKIGTGGVYFLLSHVLGARISSAIGILYCFGQGVACSLYTVGFGESIAGLFKVDNEWVAKGIAISVVLLLLGINLAGVKWVIRLQLILLMTLFVAVLDFMVGSFVKTSPEDGVTGYLLENLQNNTGPSYINHETFFTVFGVFFPTATGVFAGINMSGDLRNPRRSIPVGTLSAVGVSFFLYMCFALILGATCDRFVLQTDYMIASKVSVVKVFLLAGLYVSSITSCMGGLYGAPRILQAIATNRITPFSGLLSKGLAVLGPLFLSGLYVSSMSAALAGLTGSPRVLQAIAVNAEIGFLSPLGRSVGANKVPVFSLATITAISLIFILIGNVNVLGPIVTMPFMVTYAAVDYAYFSLAMSYDMRSRRQERLEGRTKYRAIGPVADEEDFARPVHKKGHNDLDKLFPERLENADPKLSAQSRPGNVSPTEHTLFDAAAAKGKPVPDLDDNQTLLQEQKGSLEGASVQEQAIERQPVSWYSHFCNRWLSLFGVLASLVIMFSIQWIYALACLVVVLALYFYFGQANPGLYPGVAEFSFYVWIREGVKSCCRRGPPPPEEIVVTPHTPAMRTDTAQLTEDNEDFAERGKYHQSQLMEEDALQEVVEEQR